MVDLLGEVVGPRVAGHPDVAELDDGSEAAPLEFVDEVVELVGVFDEAGTLALDAQLHFNDNFVPIEQVDLDILGDVLEPTSHVHYLEQLWPLFVDPLQLVVEGGDFLLLGVAPAPQQVVHEEGDEHGDLPLRRILDVGVLFLVEGVVGALGSLLPKLALGVGLDVVAVEVHGPHESVDQGVEVVHLVVLVVHQHVAVENAYLALEV